MGKQKIDLPLGGGFTANPPHGTKTSNGAVKDRQTPEVVELPEPTLADLPVVQPQGKGKRRRPLLSLPSRPMRSRKMNRWFVWGYLKALGRLVGDHTRFGQYRLAPQEGPRSWVYKLSGGRWNFGDSFSRRRLRAVRSITRVKDGEAFVFAFFSRGGGVGKTTTATTLAQALHEVLVGVPVLLLDKNPAGTVQAVTNVKFGQVQAVIDNQPDEACFTIHEASRNRSKLTSIAQVRWRFATMPDTGLFVVTYPEDKRLAPKELRRLIKALRNAFPIVVIDCDQHLDHADTQVVLEEADVVAVPAIKGDEKRIRQAAGVIQTLKTDRFNRRSDRVVFVVNEVWFNLLHRGTTRSVRILNRIRQEADLEPYSGAVATLPWNWLIDKGKVFLVRSRSPWFRLHALELAALLIEKAREVKSVSHVKAPT